MRDELKWRNNGIRALRRAPAVPLGKAEASKQRSSVVVVLAGVGVAELADGTGSEVGQDEAVGAEGRCGPGERERRTPGR
jgi:hypothetical protein